MISTSDFRIGKKLKVEGELWEIVDFQNARTAQRRAKVTTKLRNLKTGRVLERVFASGETFEEPEFEHRSMQYMYTDGTSWNFMDNSNYEQVALTEEHLEGYAEFLMENHDYKVLYFEGKPISLDLPTAVVLEVTDSEPGVKGDSVSNLTKSATLETGLVVKVPLFIKIGDKVKVDTRTKEYLERATG
ncbi:MAG: elongation factor P [Candidatus Zixiibacteriota bacterium]